MAPKRSGFTILLAILATLTMLGVAGVSQAEDCPHHTNGRDPRCDAHAPVLTIVKSGVVVDDGGRIGFPDPGDRIRYTVNVRNTGTGPATTVEVRDFINEGLSGGGCARGQDQPTTVGSGGGSGFAFIFIVSTLDAGRNLSATFTVDIPAGTFHDCNRASVRSDQTPLQYSNTVVF